MNSIAIPFGLKDGRMVSVDAVPSGNTCGCVCPECGGALTARKGEKNIWHFAHQNLEGCNSPLETSIHLMAKEVLSKAGTFRIPKIEIRHPHTKEKITISEETDITIDEVFVERKLDEIRPDLIITCKGRKMLIEIYVTHKVGSEKIEKVKEYGHSCIEIDCRKWREINSTDRFTEFLLKGTKDKTWIYNEKAEQARLKLMAELPKPKPYTPRNIERAPDAFSYDHDRREMMANFTPERIARVLETFPNDHPLLTQPKPEQDEPSRLTYEQWAMIKGIEPVRCRECGIQTRDWAILHQQDWTCTCKKCLNR